MVPTGPTPQIFAAFPEAPAAMFIEDPVDGINNIRIPVCARLRLIIGRPRQTDTAATALHRQTVLGDQIGDGFTLVGRP